MIDIGDWFPLLQEEFTKEYYQNLRQFLKEEYQNKTIYPDKFDVLNCLKFCQYSQTKVVILGQDPYHNGAAHGLCFSSKIPSFIPQSLRNIYAEMDENNRLAGEIFDNQKSANENADSKILARENKISSEIESTSNKDKPLHRDGNLQYLAEQGVLLLNSVLTVEKGKANSHKGKGWEIFTDKIISLLNDKQTPIVFLLWGNDAKQKQSLITNPKHLVLTTTHPSPFSARYGFLGSKHFLKTNQFLSKNGQKTIEF